MLGDLEDGLGVVIFVNTPADLQPLASYALTALQAATHKAPVPSLPAAVSATAVTNAADYAGTYVAGDGKEFRIDAKQDQLQLEYKGGTVLLEKRGADRFVCAHPDFALFLLQFGRQDGVVVEASAGAAWYVNDRYRGPRKFDYPPEWNAYPGHYRTSSREHVNFRVVLKKGNLFMVSAVGQETPLIPTKARLFRVGDSPEWLQFDTTLNEKTLRVNYSGSDYHRDFIP